MVHVERASVGVIEVAVAALATAHVMDNVEPVLAALMVAMDSDVAGFYWHDVLGLSWPVAILPAEALRLMPIEHRAKQPTAAGVAMHPGWGHCLRGPTGPFAVTDVVSERSWRSSPAENVLRPLWGRHFQFAIPVYSPTSTTTFWAWVLARQGSDFTERHRELARRVRPVLTRVACHYGASSAHPAVHLDGLLTEREHAVLGLLARDLTAGQIGRRMGISPRTVHKHVEHLYHKLGVHSRHQAVERAVATGLLDVGIIL